MSRCLRLPSVLGLFLLIGGAMRAQDRPVRPALTPEALRDAQRTDWYGAYVQNKKIGYVKTALARRGQGADAPYIVTQLFKLSILANGSRLETQTTQEEEYDSRPPYALRRCRLLMTQGASRQEVTLARTAKGFVLTTVTNGDKTTKDVPPLDHTLADVLASYVWMRGRPAVGATLLSQDVDFDELRINLERRKLLATKKALVKGVEVTYHEVEVTLLRKGVKLLERYDGAGNLLSGHLGDAFEMRLETEEQARSLKGGTDLFVLGLAKIDRPLGDHRKVVRLVVEVTGKDAALLGPGPCQAVGRSKTGAVICKLGKGHGQPQRATPEDIKESLQATVSYPSAHARVLALARKAVGNAATDREKVGRLVRFVHEYIRPSYRGKGLIVLDLLDKKEGDCTAYAALLTTVARAAGIPCREVSGLLYTGDAQKAFGGHAWNEVVLDGHWLPVDASCDEVEIDATHISFGSDTNGGWNLMRLFGNLSLRLVEVEHDK
jgi:hypothetical protein